MASGALPPALPMVKIGTDHYLGRRHRVEHPAAAPARSGRQAQHAGVPGRPVQRARRAAARHPGRDGPPQGHHVFLAHALQHRCLSPHPHWKTRLPRRWPRFREEQLRDEERRLQAKSSSRPARDQPSCTSSISRRPMRGTPRIYEFSGTSMREHWQSGYEDTKRTLKHQKWLTIRRRAPAFWCMMSIARRTGSCVALSCMVLRGGRMDSQRCRALPGDGRRADMSASMPGPAMGLPHPRGRHRRCAAGRSADRRTATTAGSGCISISRTCARSTGCGAAGLPPPGVADAAVARPPSAAPRRPTAASTACSPTQAQASKASARRSAHLRFAMTERLLVSGRHQALGAVKSRARCAGEPAAPV